MSIKWLKVSFGVEVVVFFLCTFLIAVQGFDMVNALLLLGVFLISLGTFYVLYKRMKDA